MSDQAGNFEKSLSTECSFEPHRFFRGSIVLVENSGSDRFVSRINRHKSFAVGTQAQRPDGITKCFRCGLRTMAYSLPKALGIYLRLRRSGELRRVRAGVLREYLARHRKYHCFASARTDIDGK
jgi:hypothetical protein